VTDRECLHLAYHQIVETMPPIAGVCQAAVVLRDAPLREMTFDQMNDVLGPKVNGSIYLDELFQEDTLDFFMFFSSLVAVLGNYGQSNYTAANSFMASLAAQRRQRGLVASSIDIGALLGVGYITRKPYQIEMLHKKATYSLMNEHAFRTAFVEAVIAGRSDGEIITGIPKIAAKDSTTLFKNPVFSHYRISEASQSPDKSAVISQLQRHVADTIKPDSRLGVDSLTAVEIRHDLLKAYHVTVPILKILNGTVEEILESVLTVPEAKAQQQQQPSRPQSRAQSRIGSRAPSRIQSRVPSPTTMSSKGSSVRSFDSPRSETASVSSFSYCDESEPVSS
jgi:hybrid polyketide synthase / nonribosomal peptide synthetase ACE1